MKKIKKTVHLVSANGLKLLNFTCFPAKSYEYKMPAMKILRSRRVVTGGKTEPAAIAVQNGMIEKLLPYDTTHDASESVDYGNLVLMPSIIDAHVHINEPGRTDWEGFETATKAAAAGGITTLADMPLNSSPVTTNLTALQQKRNASEGKLAVDCGFYAGLVPGNENEIPALLDAGVWGVKAFLCHSGIDEFPAASEKELSTVMPLLAKRGVPLLVHAELPGPNAEVPYDETSYRQFSASRPESWETDALELLIKLCRKTGCRVHIVHLASAKAAAILKEAKNEGLPITAETAPHYLFFSSDTIPDGNPLYKCAPPIRNSHNRDALADALMSGVIDFIATDHSPCPPGLKELESGNLKNAWGGISSMQLLLPLAWTVTRKRGASPADICRWLCSVPANFLNIFDRTGDIAPGKEASFVIWDPEQSFTVRGAELYHRHKLTPYDGETLSGVVKSVWLRGQNIFDGSTFLLNDTGIAR